jgi:hypothetical protein
VRTLARRDDFQIVPAAKFGGFIDVCRRARQRRTAASLAIYNIQFISEIAY